MEENSAGLIKDAWILTWVLLFLEGLGYGGKSVDLGPKETGV